MATWDAQTSLMFWSYDGVDWSVSKLPHILKGAQKELLHCDMRAGTLLLQSADGHIYRWLVPLTIGDTKAQNKEDLRPKRSKQTMSVKLGQNFIQTMSISPNGELVAFASGRCLRVCDRQCNVVFEKINIVAQNIVCIEWHCNNHTLALITSNKWVILYSIH